MVSDIKGGLEVFSFSVMRLTRGFWILFARLFSLSGYDVLWHVRIGFMLLRGLVGD